MSSAERAQLNAPRQSSLSSQMAAITAAADRDEDSPSPPGGGNRGKLEQVKMETDIKQEECETNDIQNNSHGGKGIKSEMDIKQEIKSESIEGNGVAIKEEPGLVKEEPAGSDTSNDIKPPSSDTANTTSAGGERKHKSKKIFIL